MEATVMRFENAQSADGVNMTVYEIVKIENDLDGLYEAIGATIIDIVRTTLKDIYLVLDDTGRLTGKVPTFLSTLHGYSMAGTVLLARHDNEGEMVNLTNDDINLIFDSLKVYTDGKSMILGL